jgi:hypothetical protein
VQIYTTVNDCEDVGNILGSYFVNAFSAFPSHSLCSQLRHKISDPSMLISVERTGTRKNQLKSGQKSMGDDAVLLHCSLLRTLEQNRPVCWSIVVKKMPTVRSPFLVTFPSDRIPKATKDISVHFFIHSRNSDKLHQ